MLYSSSRNKKSSPAPSPSYLGWPHAPRRTGLLVSLHTEEEVRIVDDHMALTAICQGQT